MGLTKEDVKQAYLEAMIEHDDKVRRENTCPNCYADKKPAFYVKDRGSVCIDCWLKYGGTNG